MTAKDKKVSNIFMKLSIKQVTSNFPSVYLLKLKTNPDNNNILKLIYPTK